MANISYTNPGVPAPPNPGIGPSGFRYKRGPARRCQHFIPPGPSSSFPGNPGNPGQKLNPGNPMGPPGSPDTPTITSPPPQTPVLTYSSCKDTFTVDYGAVIPGLKRFLVQHAASNTGPWQFYCYLRRERASLTFNNYFGGSRWVRISLIGLDNSVTSGTPFQPTAPNVAPPTMSVASMNATTFVLPANYMGASGVDGITLVLVTSDKEQIDYQSVPILKIPVANSAVIEATKVQYNMDSISSPQSPSTMAVTVTGAGGTTVKFTTDGSDPTSSHGSDSGTVVNPAANVFGMVLIARAFSGGCQSPPTYILVDKKVGMTTSFNTVVGAHDLSGSCDLFNYQRNCLEPSGDPGPDQTITRSCWDIYKSNDPAAILAQFIANAPTTLTGPSVDREIFVSSDGASVFGATARPDSSLCGAGVTWTDGTLTVTASDQAAAWIYAGSDSGLESQLAAFPDVLTCVTSHLLCSDIADNGIWNPDYQDKLFYTFFGPNRISFAGSTPQHTSSSNNLSVLGGGTGASLMGWNAFYALESWIALNNIHPYYLGDVSLFATRAPTFALDVWNADDLLSMPPPPGAAPPTINYTPNGTSGSHVTFTPPVGYTGVIIYYTTDGSTPTTSSAQYSGSFLVGNVVTIKFFETATGHGPSSISTSVSPDNNPATISSVTPPSNGAYTSGQNLDFTFNYSEAVTVTGAPYVPLVLDSGTVNVPYLSGSGTSALVFRYVIQSGDLAAGGISITSPIHLNGGTINDADPAPALLTFTPPSMAGISVGLQLPTADPDLFMWLSSDTGISHDGFSHMATTNDWTDRSGNGHHFSGGGSGYQVFNTTPSTVMPSGKPSVDFLAAQAAYQSNSGATTSLLAGHTVYMLLMLTTWQLGKYFCDGGNGNDSVVYMSPSSGDVSMYAGATVTTHSMPTNQWFIVTAVFNGASSSIQINNLTVATGNAGSVTPGRMVVGGYSGGGGFFPDFSIGAMIVSNSVNNGTIQAIHKSWLANYAGISI